MSRELNLLQPLQEGRTDPTAEDLHPLLTALVEREVKQICEALLFSTSEPLTLSKMQEILSQFHPIRPKELKRILQELQEEYERTGRAFQLVEMAGGYLLQTGAQYAPYIQRIHLNRRGEKLSPAAAEVLAIIAYRQPITRPGIEAIRGVDSSSIVQGLLERTLIEPCGRLELPGRPTLFRTTSHFLHYFGLQSLEELPPLPLSGLNEVGAAAHQKGRKDRKANGADLKEMVEDVEHTEKDQGGMEDIQDGLNESGDAREAEIRNDQTEQ